MDIHRYNLDGSGLTRFFGDLEARIMEAVWQGGVVTIRDICAALGPASHYKTVMTVTNRLVEKGLLLRERTGERAHLYCAAIGREAFLAQVTSSIANGLLGDFGRQALAEFVSAAGKVDPAYLDELERLLRERKEEGG
ncbi:MAG: BlaI/MecI/CopY family transcriptional regulator [Thermomicrobiales bacterium]